MNVAINDICFSNSLTGNFNELENLLDAHLYSINLKRTSSEVELLYKHISKTTDIQPFGIVIPVDEKRGMLIKIWSLIYTARKAREVKSKLSKITHKNFACYGIYPEISNPVAIYELNSQAESYANQYLLPPIQKGLNGFLRRVIFSIIKFHPSTGGIAIISKNS